MRNRIVLHQDKEDYRQCYRQYRYNIEYCYHLDKDWPDRMILHKSKLADKYQQHLYYFYNPDKCNTVMTIKMLIE